jgi:hypothetical protein
MIYLKMLKTGIYCIKSDKINKLCIVRRNAGQTFPEWLFQAPGRLKFGSPVWRAVRNEAIQKIVTEIPKPGL